MFVASLSWPITLALRRAAKEDRMATEEDLKFLVTYSSFVSTSRHLLRQYSETGVSKSEIER